MQIGTKKSINKQEQNNVYRWIKAGKTPAEIADIMRVELSCIESFYDHYFNHIAKTTNPRKAKRTRKPKTDPVDEANDIS